LPRKKFASPSSQSRARFVISAAILLTIVPSIYLAVQLVKDEVFKTEASAYLASVGRTEKNLFIMRKELNPDSQEIILTVAGKQPDKAMMERLLAQLNEHRLEQAKLVVHTFQQDDGADLNLIKTELQQDLYRNSLQLLETKNAKIQELEEIIRNQKDEQSKQVEQLGEYNQVRDELKAQYPELVNVIITHGRNAQIASAPANAMPAIQADTLIVYLESRKPIANASKTRIRHWLAAHYKLKDVYVFSKRV